MLNCETNTPSMERRIRSALRDHICGRHAQLDFEHGQWWLTCRRCGGQWSVNDASGPGSVGGFSFERVTEGEEL